MPIMGQYEYEIVPGHPRETVDHQVYKHILIAEQKLGRFLLPGETVHHIDGNKINNSENNLLVFDTHEDHARFHALGPKAILIKKDNGAWICSKQETCCIDCGTKISRDKQRCVSCYRKFQHNGQEVVCDKNKIPIQGYGKCDRATLKSLIRNNSFTNIGKMYDVSDNAIRKWCKNYKLPFRSTEIKKYTDEEWGKI